MIIHTEHTGRARNLRTDTMHTPKSHIMRDAVYRRMWLMYLHDPHQLPSHEHVTSVASFGRRFTVLGKGFQRITGENGKRYIINLRNQAVKLVHN